jgi:exopolysaccharide production protein ExoY
MKGRGTLNLGLSDAVIQEITVSLSDMPKWKRSLDVLGSLVGLIFLSPIIVFIGCLIFLTDGRPLFFRQARFGVGGEMFDLYKFRSMRSNAEEVLISNPELYRQYVENDFKLPEGADPRVTKLGLFLRKTSLDELPQFWNVLRGDMSLVGPRPIVAEELEEYGNRKALFLKMRPGITGVWQVSGRSELKYPERAEVELSYLNDRGFLYDLGILVKTVTCVFKRKGAF